MAGPSNYPGGFSQGVTLQNTPVSIPHPGRYFGLITVLFLPPVVLAGLTVMMARLHVHFPH